ncbi:ABC transporter substrate-binding protein [Rhodoferax sp. PAMC 29310]|uniref:ABC transporter substrate-binding protein n=1 Tax=Rhodoferax sp. PAMC 29310 TaxID=2822760 RepID=UPI001F0A600C|nr:ABC transporter substrate-binding protein [Rhodoferax sp. PAMC 29310]
MKFITTTSKMTVSASLLGLTAVLLPSAAWSEIRVMCYQDGNECEVTADVIKRYEAQAPGAKVILDVVPYKTVVEQLPIQLAAGQGPDIARVSEIGGLSKNYIDISPYVKDRKYWEANYGSTLPWMRSNAGDKGIYGFMSQLTMTGPFVNKTLFDQAKIALPGPKATWDEWADAARKVAKATQTPAAMAWDRSGHRFAGPAVSYGAKIFDAKGNLTVDEGYKTAVGKFVAWHKDGTMLKDVWGGSGGSSYADSVGEFKNGRVVMILSGSWQINRMQKEIGNAFDWVAVPNPCGTTACSGMPGGAAWVALKTTKSPKEVGQFLDFMAQEANVAEFASKTSSIPAHAGVAKAGVSYPNAGPAAQAALGVFTSGTASLAPAAYALQGYKYNRALMLPTVTRVTQALVGEITVDEAVNKIGTDMNEAVKQAEK